MDMMMMMMSQCDAMIDLTIIVSHSDLYCLVVILPHYALWKSSDFATFYLVVLHQTTNPKTYITALYWSDQYLNHVCIISENQLMCEFLLLIMGFRWSFIL